MIWEGSVELKTGTVGVSAAVQAVTMFVISIEVPATDKQFPFKLIQKLYVSRIYWPRQFTGNYIRNFTRFFSSYKAHSPGNHS
jgi:hypothetical protein